jgi:hypothetical protein
MEVVAAFTERVSSIAEKNRYQINVINTARSGQLPFLGLFFWRAGNEIAQRQSDRA